MKRMVETVDTHFPPGTLVVTVLRIIGYDPETHEEIIIPESSHLTILSMIQSYRGTAKGSVNTFISRRALWSGGLVDVSTYGLKKVFE